MVQNFKRRSLPPLGLLIAFALIALFLDHANGQSFYPTDGTTPMGLQPGSPAGSYALSGFDNVNLYNGALDFRLPLYSLGKRRTGHMAAMTRNTKSER